MNGPRQRQAELPNVLRLYEELGVHPEEGLARLTERYRQRLRALHPDRGGEGGGAELGWLTRSYRDAVAFEREHGRLPGASGEAAAGPAGGEREARRPLAGSLRRARGRRSGSGAHWRWLLAGMALGALLLAGAGEVRHRLLLDARPMESLATIRVGSTPEEVLRIQGPPYERRGTRWHYGASWIDFAAGRVSGWHSARQYPLQVDQPEQPASLE